MKYKFYCSMNEDARAIEFLETKYNLLIKDLKENPRYFIFYPIA